MIRRLFLALAFCALAAAAHATCTNSTNPIVPGMPGAPFTCDTGSTPQSTDIVQGGAVATGSTVGWTWGQIFSTFGTGTTPGGNPQTVQFNNFTAFGGDPTFTFNPTTKAVSIGGTLGVTGITTFGAGSENILTVTPGASGSNATLLSTPAGSTGGISVNARSGNFVVSGASAASGAVQANALQMIAGITNTLSGSTVPAVPFLARQNWGGTGTVAGNTSYATASIVTSGDNASVVGAINGLLIEGNYGGTNFQGLRDGVNVAMSLNTASTLNSPGEGLIGIITTVTGAVNVGGVSGNDEGSVFGANPVASLGPGATFWKQVVGTEIDYAYAAGSTVTNAVGLQIVKLPGTGTALVSDTMLVLAASIGSVNFANVGIQFGSYQSPFPLTAGSYLSQVQSFGGVATSGAGFDLNELALSGAGPEGGGFYWRSPGIQLLPSAVQTGYGTVDGSGTGLLLDTPYQQMTASAGSITVAAGGSNFSPGAVVSDIYGDVFTVTAPAGVVTAVASVISRGWQTSPPSNPVTFTGRSISGSTSPTLPGTGLTLNLTWSAATVISLGTSAATAINIGNSGSTTNVAGAIQAGGTAGVTCAAGVPSSSFTTKNGIVTHC